MAARHTALLLNDDSSATTALRKALASQPVELGVARDASEAIGCLEKASYCGLIVALNVGFDVLRYMSEKGVRLPTVLIGDDLPQSLRELPVIDQIKIVLRKPADPSLLAAAVLGLCGIDR